MTNSIQNNIEGIVPKIQFFVLDSFKIQSEITNLEYQLSNIPEAMRLNEEIRNLKKSLLENQSSENSLREEGKKMMMDSNIKEVTALDGTIISLHFTPGSLVVGEGANIPDEFYKVKTSKDLDKTLLKKAITDGTFTDEKVFIQKDCKFVIKTK